uniref:Nuclear protein 1 n=1 Tax=Pararge aegeria TaxID=116150 RepID=S4P2H7_9NEOP
MSEAFFDEYDYYNFEHDKHIFSSHSGKQRTKKEVSEHTNHFDPSGHSRKIVKKFVNTETNKKVVNKN